MAVIKYEINGKANTKPMKDTEHAAQGMFKKISDIDNKLKAFAGVKVFAEVGKAINNSLREYDKFKSSLNEETSLTKQMNSIKTSLSATLGTVRDEMAESLGNIFNGDFMDILKNTIPKVGATLIASMKVVEAVVRNIKTNFDTLKNPETWNEFFSHARTLAGNFCTFFASILKDTFSFAINFFKWSFENMNLFQLLWAPARMMLDNFFKLLGVKKNPEIVKRFADAEERTGRNNRANLSNIPVFGLSDDTKKALAGFNGELGRTFKILRDTLTGDAGLFDREYAAALEKLGITIGGMGDGLKKAIEEKLSLIGKDTGKANDNFSGSNNFIKGILGSINTNITQKIRDKIDSVNRQYDLSNDKIIKLVEQLKNAGSTDEINNLFNAIKDEIKNIDELTKTLKSLENEVIKERLSIARENTGAATKGFTDSNSLINGILGSATGGAIDKIRDRMNSLNRQFEITTGKIDKLSEQLKSAATVEEINSLFSAINSEIQAINNLTGSMDGLKDKAERAKNAFDLVQGSLQAIGELGQVIQAAMSSNWIGLIIMAITKLADTFSKISSNAAAAQNILSVLFDVILETISELQPYLDMLFKPLLDIVTALGRIIGVVLNLLVPVIGLLTSMSEAFNILTPILNIGALFLAGLTDAFGALWNVIAEVIRKITFGIVRLGRMQTDNYQKMVDSINAEQNYDSYQNNSTSYTVQGDFYINIYYNHSYVNGDAREIAVNLRNEIRAAEMAGY